MAGAARLLELILTHNSAALPKLYRTGVFFFALAYLGSNLAEISSLFKVHATALPHAPTYVCGFTASDIQAVPRLHTYASTSAVRGTAPTPLVNLNSSAPVRAFLASSASGYLPGRSQASRF